MIEITSLYDGKYTVYLGGKGSSAPSQSTINLPAPPVRSKNTGATTYIPPTFTPMTVPTYTPVTPYTPPRVPTVPVYVPPEPLPVDPTAGYTAQTDAATGQVKQVANDPVVAYNEAKQAKETKKQEEYAVEMGKKAKQMSNAPMTYTREERRSIKGASLLG